jgi:hypothetical protein
VQSDAWIVVTFVIKYGAGVVEGKESTDIKKTTFARKTCNSE